MSRRAAVAVALGALLLAAAVRWGIRAAAPAPIELQRPAGARDVGGDRTNPAAVAARRDEAAAGDRSGERSPPPPTPGGAAVLVPDRVVVLRGTVVAASDGARIDGAVVSARGAAAPEPLGEGESDDAGRYEIELVGSLPPLLELVATAEGFAPQRTLLELAADAVTARSDFALEHGFTLRAIVTAAGQPVARATLALDATLPGFAGSDAALDERTDASGSAYFADVVDLPRHDLRLTVHADGCFTRELAPLALPVGSDELAVVVELQPLRPLRGEVRAAATGAAIADATVELGWRGDGPPGDGDSTATAEDGRFELDWDVVAPERSVLLVTAEGFQSVALDRPGASGLDVRVVLAPAARWRGRVVAAESGAPLKGAEVRARPRALPSATAEEREESATCDADGWFELPLEAVVAGGEIEVEVDAAGRAIESQVLPFAEVAAVAGWPRELRVAAVVRLHGRVVRAADGEPLSKAAVRFLRAGVTLGLAHGSHPTTDADGRFDVQLAVDAATAAAACSVIVEYRGRRHSLGRLPGAALAGAGAEGVELELPVEVAPLRTR